MLAGAVILGLLGLAFTALYGRSLLKLHRMRKVSEVTGTVVGRDRQRSSRGSWTYPVVEFSTRDGQQIRRTFRQLARATIGRKVRIVYDPRALAAGHARSKGLTLPPEPAYIYSVWMLLFLWLMVATGLALLTGCVAVLAAS